MPTDQTEPKEVNLALSPLTAHDQALSMMAIFERIASAPDAGQKVEVIRAMMDMQRQLTKDQAEREFNESMRKVQAEIQPVAKKAASDRYKFAKYDAIDDAIRPIYTKHGFSLTFGSKDSAKGLCIICTALHVGGHTRDYELSGALDTVGAKGLPTKTEIQGTGSSTSYLQKYLTRMIFNVVTKDDTDGNREEDLTLITVEQAAALDLRLRALSDKALPNFLAWAKVEKLTDILAKKYIAVERAVTDMEVKAKKKGAA